MPIASSPFAAWSHPSASRPLPSASALLASLDAQRLGLSSVRDAQHQSDLGQFLTPQPVARFMAGLFAAPPRHVRLLDAGAGIGALTAAAVAAWCAGAGRPQAIHIVAYERDERLTAALDATLLACRTLGEPMGVAVTHEVVGGDFIAHAVAALEDGIFAQPVAPFTAAILNPPYRKIASTGDERLRLRRIGIETSNLYTAFLALAVRLLAPDGELVAITPRSFCNGPYFRPFRRDFLAAMTISRLHVFEARDRAFSDDAVLQENLITYAVKRAPPADHAVVVSASRDVMDGGDAAGASISARWVPLVEVVRPDDPEAFIRIDPDGDGGAALHHLARFTATLVDLGLTVSTGRVVDFRARAALRADAAADTVPLIWACHFADGFVRWPRHPSRKPNAIVDTPATHDLLIPNGHYVLVKRFSTKEEARRLVAVVHDPARVAAAHLGIENHLNYFHCAGAGLDPWLARGLAAFINSSWVETVFRRFNGHTQVNATDLRSLRYPTEAQLKALGRAVGDRHHDPVIADRFIANGTN